jgi:hypothetical protein
MIVFLRGLVFIQVYNKAALKDRQLAKIIPGSILKQTKINGLPEQSPNPRNSSDGQD